MRDHSQEHRFHFVVICVFASKYKDMLADLRLLPSPPRFKVQYGIGVGMPNWPGA
jgi:hypothetical protein